MTPFLSFVFPAFAGGIELIRRSVLALRAQTAPVDSFEAVVAFDGGDEGAAADLEALIGPQPFAVRVVPSPRTQGREALPHRNHARNRGCEVARGTYLWVLDGDILADRFAVEHLRELDARTGRPLVATPCLAEPRVPPEDWIAITRAAVEAGDAVTLMASWRTLGIAPWTSSSRLGSYSPGPPKSHPWPKLIEGQPAFPRWLWEALGGYDERFVGYGGNKVELVRRMTMLQRQEGLVDVRLVTSLLFVHQPHHRDPLRFDEEHRARNWAAYRARIADVEQRAPWWLAQIEAVRAACTGGNATPCPRRP